MADTTADATKPAATDEEERSGERDETKDGLVVDELLIEDVSIDGMCGVY